MSAIVKELTIEATPQSVWGAITESDEIEKWWAYKARVKPEVGSIGEFSFRQGGFVMQLEVAELEQDEKVRWISRQVSPQWAGTSISWQLTPVHNGTRLIFTHDGFDQVDERAHEAWVFFLASLKSYMETGKGTPGNPPNYK
jgi:uncharacterized protein YndB with AHSA1/START domain